MAIFEDLLGRLATPSKGRNRRISSNEQPNWNDGNFDMTWLQPGEVLELPLLEGPGIINHIWLTSHAGGANELNALSMRVYWDGREAPAIEVPLGDFFAVGQRPAVVESFPMQVSPSGSLTCYWRMPFAGSARLVFRNDNPDRSTGLYWQVDWVELDSLPPETPYFHARYRQEYPAVMGRDYLIADIEGCGHFVGAVMAVTLAQDGWFGEGDDFFYIDGEEIPSLQGTGSEDYFNDAWGFRTRTSLWFGQPRWQGHRAGDHGICYRWHILDPVTFEKSLKVAIEHKGNRANAEEAWYIERPDFFSSIGYWYQTGEPKPFGSLPPYHERRVPWEEHHFVRAFRQAAVSEGGELSVQAVGFFGGRPSLQWHVAEPLATLSVPFVVNEEGDYAIRLIAFTTSDSGGYDVLLDGQAIADNVSFQTTTFDETDLLLGRHTLTIGEHTLTFRSLAGDAENEQLLSLELLRLLRLPPEVDREVKTHNEAHFVRLGIGRAVYAFRLAYGKLPASLQELIDAGLLSPRYLTDENGLELNSRCEGQYFTVESTAPNGWQHRWLGLDARH